MSIEVLVGLGNPGNEYTHTRHNAGMWVLDLFARQEKIIFSEQKKFEGLFSKIKINNKIVYLLKPLSFMNLSGKSVASLLNFYKISPESILIIHDELDLPSGVIQLKLGGGHAGHNGLRDIIEKLGTQKFYRLRIGIGRPKEPQEKINYVLSEPKEEERNKIDKSIEKSLNSFYKLFLGDISKAMQAINTKEEEQIYGV